MNRLTSALVIGVLSGGALLATSSPAAAACDHAALPETSLRQIADGVAVSGKKVGAGWESVVLGTVTEVRRKSPKYRYRITMRVDSTLGRAELPPIYTFFGSSRGTFAFETGKVYAVALAKRIRGPVTPATELWAEPCDAVVAVADLAAAHEVIASTKPGYQPSPAATPSKLEVEVATVTPRTAVELPPRVAKVQGSPLPLPDSRSLEELIKLAIVGIALLGLGIGIAAAAESRWSHRHLA